MSKVVVGIDFGTSGIGYAYSFENHINSIILSDFPEQSADRKVSSEIILDNYLKTILTFGSECKEYIRLNDKSEYEYFKDIKMNLYKNIYTLKSTNGKEANIELVISKILEYISDNAINQIKNLKNSLEKKDIKWVLTVPAIWEEKSKQIMINASIKAGLINENDDKSLFLALEPEVAGIYFFLSYLIDSKFEIPHIKEGKPYIICDIGAGTVDICTHSKIIEDDGTKGLIEEYPPIGGDYGGNKINEEFIKRLIIPLFGEEKVKELQNNSDDSEDWVKFEKEIEEIKRSCCNNISSKGLVLDCNLFNNEADKKTLEYYISEYEKKDSTYRYKIQKKRNWNLEFPSQIFIDIVEELSQKIFLKIEEIYNNAHTGYIIFTGAGSKNQVLINYIYNYAKEKKIEIFITPSIQPEIAIIKGSVLFGFQNNIIRKRKAKYTLGIKMAYEWKQKYEGKGIKKYEELDKKYYWTNLFNKFYTINEHIEFNKKIIREFKATNPNPELIFYKTNKKDCTYIDEKDENGNLIIEEFAKVKYNIEDFDINKNEVIIEMKLGGTYIDVCVTYKKIEKN